MSLFITALQFLTIITISPKRRMSAEELGIATSLYPLVGAFIGCVLVLVNTVFSYFFSLYIACMFIIIAEIILSGALHLDGFIDTCDALLSRANKEKFLEVMRDSRVGTGGVISVVCLLLLKFLLLVNIPDSSLIKGQVLILMPVIGRYSLVLLASLFPYARESGSGKAVVEFSKAKQLIIATLWTLVLIFFLYPLRGGIIFLITVIICLIWGRYLRGRIGGVTGDTLGAATEITEVVMLLVVALRH